MSCLCVRLQTFLVAGGVTTITIACGGLRGAWEGDGVQVGLAQPLGSMPPSAASVLTPGGGEGARQADGGRQGGSAVGPRALAVPHSLTKRDGCVGGASVWDRNRRKGPGGERWDC